MKKSLIVIVILMLILAGCQSLASFEAEQSNQEDTELLNKIIEIAKQLKVEPIDAKVDRIWKAIPGYNGLEVDVDRTLALTKRLNGDKIPVVFKEIKPNVTLEQLGPHPIYKGNPKKQMASIMINVAWGNEFIPSILETLQQADVKSTFFFDGSWLKDNLEVAKQIQEQGHELSNHAYSHKDMGHLSWNEAKEEITKTEQLLQEHFAVNNTLFAPPSGHFDDETVKLAHELGLKTVLWTLDTVDWRNPSPELIVKKIAMSVEPGSLILMHPTYASSTALPDMILEIKKKGLHIGTVSELISSERIKEEMNPFRL